MNRVALSLTTYEFSLFLFFLFEKNVEKADWQCETGLIEFLPRRTTPPLLSLLIGL